MTGRAIPSADTAARPSHVRLMIVRIDIDPVPTRWEVDLRPHPVRTIMVEEAVPLSPIGIASMIGSIVETDETDRSTIRVTSIVHYPGHQHCTPSYPHRPTTCAIHPGKR